MTLSQEQQVFVQHISRLILFANSRGINLTFGEAYRSTDQQSLYFNGYTLETKDNSLELVKTTKKSKTMNSLHLKRLAVDFNFFIGGELTYEKEMLQEVGDYWESLDVKNRWGGNFNSFCDTPHFERNVS